MRIARIIVLCAFLLGAATAQGEVVYRFRDGRQTRKAPFYKAEIRYPVLSGLRERVISVFNVAAREEAQHTLDRFVEEATNRRTETPEAPGTAEQSLSLTYEVSYQSPKLLAVLSRGEKYLGGAHPETFFEVLLFDPTEGKILKPVDLFVVGTDVAGLLSTLSREDLLSRLEPLGTDAEWVIRGTQPADSNWSLVWPSKNGVCVLFEPARVAPRVTGEVIVTIPYSRLQGSLKDGLL